MTPNGQLFAGCIAAMLYFGPAAAVAMDCPRVGFAWRNLPDAEVAVRARSFAAGAIRQAQAIFKGRVSDARYAGRIQEGLDAYFVTYRSSEVLKGPAKRTLKLVELLWCDGCGRKEMLRRLKARKSDEDRFIVADPADWLKNDRRLRQWAGRVDGSLGPCGNDLAIALNRAAGTTTRLHALIREAAEEEFRDSPSD